jgi:light-regulated signal transduction histidine kinase (bacteriophytochrome)
MNIQFDLTNCDKEPIHTPGTILPHGVMLVIDGDLGEIQQAAGETFGLLGRALDALLGRRLETLLQPDQMRLLCELSAEAPLTTPRHLLDPILRVQPDRPVDACIHRTGGHFVLEFVPAELQEGARRDPLAVLQELMDGLDQAGSLQALCQLASERVRRATGYDRVMVYRFQPDESGWVYAESRDSRLVSFLDLHYPAADIPSQARSLYLRNWLRTIVQIDYTPARLVPEINPRTGQPLDMSYATLRDVSSIHREYLRNMGVAASMSISIVVQGRLWGLIACHHYSPRQLPRHLRAACEIFGPIFSSQLETRQRADDMEMHLAGRGLLREILSGLTDHADFADGLIGVSPSLIEYIVAGGAAVSAVARGGVALYLNSAIRSLGRTPPQEHLQPLAEWVVSLLDKDGLFQTDRLGELWPPAQQFTQIASGLLAISVSRQPKDLILWFRPEVVETVNWGGDPTKVIELGPNGERLTPRKSFEVWKQEVRGRATPWAAAEIQAAVDLRVALLEMIVRRLDAAARERDHLREQERLLMAELDHRVKNVLANVQALVRQSSRNAGSVRDYVSGLEARIVAMGKAHSLLTESRWRSVSLQSLIEEELAQFSRSGIAMHGPVILLTPKAALVLSLAVHELATNASKFGALSAETGKVVISWRKTGDGGTELRWIETGGPQVQKPRRRGFGSTLVERALAIETGGEARLDFLPTGVQCVVSLPCSSTIDP